MRDTTPAPAHVVDSLQSRLGRSHLLRFLTAFVLALLTWGWVLQATDPITLVTYTEVDIKSPDLGAEMVVITSLPRGTIKIEGPKSEVAKINRASLTLRLDTSEVTKPGEYRLPLIVDGPQTLAKITAVPKTVRVQVDEIVVRVMPIEIQDTTEEAGTRIVNSITPNVSQVTLTGPKSAIDRVDHVILPISVGTQTSSFTEYFIPYAVDEHEQRVSEVSVLPAQVMTRVEIRSRGKLVTVIPNVTGQPAEGYVIQQRTVIPLSILVDGPEEALRDLLFVNTEPVDISGASQSVSSRVGLADLPAGVTIVEPASGQVEVRVAIQDSSATTQTLLDLPINVINVPDGYTVTLDPETVDVTLQGPVSTLTEMTAEDIAIVIDVRGMSAGAHTMQPTVALPNNGVMSKGTNPQSVTVTLEPVSNTGVSTESAPVHMVLPVSSRMGRRITATMAD